MAKENHSLYLNPITLESQMFLQTLQLHGAKNQVKDGELLNVMDQLVDEINKFYEQCKTQIQESDHLKFVRSNDFNFILRSYTCKRCQKYLGSSAEKAAKHVTDSRCLQLDKNSSRRQTKKGKQNQKKDKLKPIQNDTSMPAKTLDQPEFILPKKSRALLREKISKFFREPLRIAEKLKQISIYDEIEKDLIDVIKPLYPESSVKLYKFGSRISGIGCENSDLDIFVDIDDTFKTFENTASQRTLDAIVKVYDALSKEKKWVKIRAIASARVPIIRTVHQNSRISCDIGFSNSLGHCNTMLMEYYFELQPIAARMCIYVKKWISPSKLSDVFSSYSLTLIIINFLQQKKLLPSLLLLQKDLTDQEKNMVGPWISNFKKLTLADCSLEAMMIPTKKNFRNIMTEFFTFIGKFDFGNYVMCPYFGSAVQLKDLADKLPDRYTNFVASHGTASELQLDKPCVVQDPIQLNHNTTKNVSSAMCKLLVNFANESTIILAENVDKVDTDIKQ